MIEFLCRLHVAKRSSSSSSQLVLELISRCWSGVVGWLHNFLSLQRIIAVYLITNQKSFSSQFCRPVRRFLLFVAKPSREAVVPLFFHTLSMVGLKDSVLSHISSYQNLPLLLLSFGLHTFLLLKLSNIGKWSEQGEQICSIVASQNTSDHSALATPRSSLAFTFSSPSLLLLYVQAGPLKPRLNNLQ